jgi:hypothetical protein
VPPEVVRVRSYRHNANRRKKLRAGRDQTRSLTCVFYRPEEELVTRRIQARSRNRKGGRPLTCPR